MRRLITFVVFTLLLLPLAASADPVEQPPRVGVLPLELLAPQEMNYLRDGIGNMLGSRLAAGRQAVLVDRASVQRALQAAGTPAAAGDFAALGRRLEADYLVAGVVTAVGGSFSLDLQVYDVERDGAAQSFFASAADEGEVIAKVDELAREIRESVFDPVAPVATAPRPVPGERQPAYISPHPERQLYGSWSDGASPFIRPSDTSWLRGYSKSHDLPMDLRAMDAADVTGDGELEFIMAGSNRVEIYRRELGRFQRIGQVPMLNRYPAHYVSTADLNGNGRAEIYISAADHRGPRSLIVEWDGEQFVTTHESLPWYIRAMHLPMEGKTLVGQQAGAGNFMRSGLFRLQPTADGSVENDSPLSLPGRLNLFDFIYADLDGDGTEEIIAINQNERLEVLSAGGGHLWRSDVYYGGTTRHLGGQDLMDSDTPLPHEVNLHYVPSRLVVRDLTGDGRPEVIVTRGNPALSRAIGKVRSFSSFEIHALRWDGAGMTEIWRTRRLDGHAPDIQLGPDMEMTDEEGKTWRGAELYVGVMPHGDGFTTLAATAVSAIYVYPVEYRDEADRADRDGRDRATDAIGKPDNGMFIILEPQGKKIDRKPDLSLLATLQQYPSLAPPSLCGGEGTCGKCLVRVNAGPVNPPNEAEQRQLGADELASGVRLACQVYPRGEVRLSLVDDGPSQAEYKTRLAMELKELPLDPASRKVFLTLSPPSLDDQTSDLERLYRALPRHYPAHRLTPELNGPGNPNGPNGSNGPNRPPAALPAAYLAAPELLPTLPQILRRADWQVTVTLQEEPPADHYEPSTGSEKQPAAATPPAAHGGQPLTGSTDQAAAPPVTLYRLVDLEAGDTTGQHYGVAFDLGTTTVAGYLMDLTNGRLLDQAAMTNPQVTFGEDLMTRLDRAHQGELAALQQAAVGACNDLLQKMLRRRDLSPGQVREAVVVGNTCMQSLLLGIDPYPAGVAPFVPALRSSPPMSAALLGLKLAPTGAVHLPPLLSGFVGSDAISDLLALDFDQPQPPHLMVDLGTNAEMALAVDGQIFACSAAAGPAFEGARISCGMRAAPGAIDRATFDNGVLTCHTIDQQPARGIAGSGLISVAAALKRAGLFNRRGGLQRRRLPAGLLAPDERGIILAPAEQCADGQPLVLTWRDLGDELVIARAAIRSGIEILLTEAGITADDLARISIAGAFGNFLDLNDALTIGLLPAIDRQRLGGVGNAAGLGAIRMLLAKGERQRARQLVERVRHVELSGYPGFNRIFARHVTRH